MHFGHFCKHIDHAIMTLGDPPRQGFMTGLISRVWMQSGIACVLMDIENTTPCCSQQILGADGSGIGIPLTKVMHVSPAWAPTTQAPTPTHGGRMVRCAIPSNDHNATTMKEARAALKDTCALDSAERDTRSTLLDFEEYLPSPVFKEALRWTLLTSHREADERAALRHLLRAVASETCITNIVPQCTHVLITEILEEQINGVHTRLEILCSQLRDRQGMGKEIGDILRSQQGISGKMCPRTLELVNYLCEQSTILQTVCTYRWRECAC